LKHKPLRLPDELSEEITRRARMKGVPDADCTRLFDRAGLLLESVKMVMQTPIPSVLSGLCEAEFEIQKLVRSLGAAREHGTIPAAQAHAKDEL
jgi:hypothetical protein